ncbi:MAG: ribonuclease H [Actinomycetaceae bacterium]|nr:ribonuclease HI [Actinomycetaceae bacterium]MDY6082404.1 ribonuclease H [Actinomycetaceae bacterium]
MAQLDLFSFSHDEASPSPQLGSRGVEQASAQTQAQASVEQTHVLHGIAIPDPVEPVGRIRHGFDAIVATDGSCSGNPGPGGWAWVEQITGARDSGGSSRTTNNIMELTALYQALQHIDPAASLLLRIDSQYVLNTVTKWAPSWRKRGWKKADGKRPLNLDIIQPLLELWESRTGRTETEWVKGHNGDAGNELVDSMAVEQTRAHSAR